MSLNITKLSSTQLEDHNILDIPLPVMFHPLVFGTHVLSVWDTATKEHSKEGIHAEYKNRIIFQQLHFPNLGQKVFLILVQVQLRTEVLHTPSST